MASSQASRELAAATLLASKEEWQILRDAQKTLEGKAQATTAISTVWIAASVAFLTEANSGAGGKPLVFVFLIVTVLLAALSVVIAIDAMRIKSSDVPLPGSLAKEIADSLLLSAETTALPADELTERYLNQCTVSVQDASKKLKSGVADLSERVKASQQSLLFATVSGACAVILQLVT